MHYSNISTLVLKPTAIGKKQALNKYEQFIQNTSCFCTCTMCDFHSFGLIFPL